MNKKGFFITGADTGVGKTFFSSILMKKYNYEYWKPIQTGKSIENDTLYIKNLDISNKRLHPPTYLLNKPLSPHLAASYEKILDPIGFSKNIHNYHVTPVFIENIVALVLPWLELIIGLFLIFGLFLEGTISITISLLVFFSTYLNLTKNKRD